MAVHFSHWFSACTHDNTMLANVVAEDGSIVGGKPGLSRDALMNGSGSQQSSHATDAKSGITCAATPIPGRQEADDNREGHVLQSCIDSDPPPQRKDSTSEGSRSSSSSSSHQEETSVSAFSALTDTEHVEVVENNETFQPTAWVHGLLSPALPRFSPASPSSSFGLAVQLASNQAADLSKYGCKCVNFVRGLATLYNEAADSYHTAALALPQGKLVGLQEWGLQWSRETKKLSQKYQDASISLHSFLNSHCEAVQGMTERFRQALLGCLEARTRRLSDGTSTTSFAAKDCSPPKIAPERKQSSGLETLGGEKDESEVQCQRLEHMALEHLLLLETDRAVVVGTSWNRILAASTDCLKELSIPKVSVVEVESETVFSERRTKKKLFAKRGSENSAAMSSGVMDAETLGLPGEVGELRDRVKMKSAARLSRLQIVRAVAGFLESIASTSTKLSGGLSQILDNVEPYETSHTSTRTVQSVETHSDEAMLAFESPSIRQVWGGIIAAVEVEAKCAIVMSSSLRSLRSEKLGKSLLNGEKAIKAANESDDFLWKQLCDAARLQARATERFRQTTAQTAKMRERVKSVDSDPGKKREASKVNKHVTKSIANVFSILPDGGAEALKIFAPGARATIAAHSLEEADTRENRGRQQLDAALESASRCLESYRSNASAMAKQHDEDEKATLDNVRVVLERFTSEIEEHRSARLQALNGVTPFAKDFAYLQLMGADIRKRVLDVAKDKRTAEETRRTKTGSQEISLPDLDGKGSDCADVDSTKIITESNVGKEGNAIVASETALMTVLRSRSASDESYSSPGNELDRATDELCQEILSSPQRSVSSMRNMFPPQDDSSRDSIETEVFLKFFWQDPVDRESAPTVLASFACSFRESHHQFPHQYGRMFVTPTRFVFNSWTGRKLNVLWADTKNAEGMPGSASIVISSKRDKREELVSIFGGFFDYARAIDTIGKLRESAPRAEQQVLVHPNNSVEPSLKILNEVPPDTTLEKMDVVLTRHLKGVSIQRFYEIAWSEGNGTSDKPLYGPWLSRVCFDVNVGDWVFEKVVGPWCGESYDQKRVITFKVKRKTHLYIGPPIANVTQTHFCRQDGNDKCVLGMTVEFEGIPYSDTFAVEVRWVARRQGTNDIQIDVGLFVDFRRNVGLLKGKIRSGTIEESKWAPVCHPRRRRSMLPSHRDHCTVSDSCP